MKRRLTPPLAIAAAITLMVSAAFGAVISMTLADMVGANDRAPVRADDGIAGTIKKTRSYYVDTPDGRFQFTDVTVTGRSLFDGHDKEITAAFLGGPNMIASTMPPLETVREGNRIVMFCAYSPTMGGRGMNAIVCGFGGVFQIVRNAAGRDVVIGQGPGSAIEETLTIEELSHRVEELLR